jgi:hypothetical protein
MLVYVLSPSSCAGLAPSGRFDWSDITFFRRSTLGAARVGDPDAHGASSVIERVE